MRGAGENAKSMDLLSMDPNFVAINKLPPAVQQQVKLEYLKKVVHSQQEAADVLKRALTKSPTRAPTRAPAAVPPSPGGAGAGGDEEGEKEQEGEEEEEEGSVASSEESVDEVCTCM